MRICQVVTGIIPVLPRGQRQWGAVEKIIGEYKEAFESLGHEVDVKFLNEVSPNQYDIVHVHMGNLALECKNRGIPYVFSLHDHHTEHYGKDSHVFKHNLEAMKASIFSITHAQHLLNYFEETDKLFYVPHGVNTSFFKPVTPPINHKLLMVANNGLAGDYGYDRKGFRYGIEAAMQLDLPITIVGAEANQKFFEIHQDLLAYPHLTLIATNPTEDELLKIYQDHTIFLHPSMLEAGHPNLTLLEAAACCLPIVGTYRGDLEIKGMHVMQELTAAEVINGINKIQEDGYLDVVMDMMQTRHKYDWLNVCKHIAKNYKDVFSPQSLNSEDIRNRHINSINTTIKNDSIQN